MREAIGAILDVITPGNVEATLNEVDAAYQTLDRDIDAAGSKVRPVFRDAWKTFYASWQKFKEDSSGFLANFFGAPENMDKAEEYRGKLSQWRDGFKAETGTQATGPSPEKPAEPGSINWKWILYGGLAIGGVVALGYAATSFGGAAHAFRGASHDARKTFRTVVG